MAAFEKYASKLAADGDRIGPVRVVQRRVSFEAWNDLVRFRELEKN